MRHDTRSKGHSHAAAFGVHFVTKRGRLFQGGPRFGGGSNNLLGQNRRTDSATSGRVKTVFNSDVIIDYDRFDLDPLRSGEVSGHLKIHDIAGIILNDVQHAFAAVHCLRGLVHLIRGGTGKNSARASGVEHPFSDKAAMHWLMSATAAGDDSHFALHRSVSSRDVVRIEVNFNEVAKCGAEAGHGIENDVLWGVNELFHVLGG